MEFCDISNQQYPPETQEKYNSFPVMKDSVKTVVNERQGGGKGEPQAPPTERQGGVWKSEGFPMKGLESSFAGFGRPQVPPIYNTSEKTMSYKNDFEYRACLRQLFCMKRPADLDEDIDEISRDEQDFDMDATTKTLDYVYETTCNHFAFQELYDNAAAKMISMDRSIGLSVLFSYDYFALFHSCLCSFYENGDKFSKESEEYKTLVKKLS
jgi:hypothetical protein